MISTSDRAVVKTIVPATQQVANGSITCRAASNRMVIATNGPCLLGGEQRKDRRQILAQRLRATWACGLADLTARSRHLIGTPYRFLQ
jgi:hypothetical protein